MSGLEQANLLSSRPTELKKCFSDLSLSKATSLTISQLGIYLSSRAGRDFSEDLLVEIFRSVNRDQGSQITFDEFVSGYAQAESLIQKKIDTLKDQLLASTQNLSESKRQLIEARARKSDNILTVKVLNSSNLKPANLISGLKGPIVSVVYEGVEALTKPASLSLLEWDEHFTFAVQRGDGDVLVQVFDSDKGRKGPLIGKVAVPIQALSDQQAHLETFDLRSDRDPNKVQGDIKLELQWIYDLPGFLEGIIQEYNQAISEDKQELETVEKYMQELQAPLNRQSANTTSTQLETKIAEKINELYNNTIAEKIRWKTFAEICIISFVIISAATMMCRSDFFNVRSK
jgi:Mg2+ and Co2+ transporter CorA